MKQLHDDKFYEAVREGVHDAVWQMITNATEAPCADFFDTIENAVYRAVSDNMLTGDALSATIQKAIKEHHG